MLPKHVSRLDLWNIILSTVVCGICFAEPDTILVFGIFYGVFGGGTRLATPKLVEVSSDESREEEEEE